VNRACVFGAIVGMPLLWPYAWAAFATMCITIATAQIVQDRVRQLRPANLPADS
jgi:hypothetical protein